MPPHTNLRPRPTPTAACCRARRQRRKYRRADYVGAPSRGEAQAERCSAGTASGPPLQKRPASSHRATTASADGRGRMLTVRLPASLPATRVGGAHHGAASHEPPTASDAHGCLLPCAAPAKEVSPSGLRGRASATRCKPAKWHSQLTRPHRAIAPVSAHSFPSQFLTLKVLQRPTYRVP